MKLGFGSLKVIESGTIRQSTYDFVFVLSSIFPRYSRIMVDNGYPLLFGAPVEIYIMTLGVEKLE